MRIIGGIYKNKKISLPTDKFTRPLKDMVRESIFNIIEHSNLIKKKILNSKILDLYSGSGSFGIECLSRGASKVYFCENYSPAFKVLKKNLLNLNCLNRSNIFDTSVTDLINNGAEIALCAVTEIDAQRIEYVSKNSRIAEQPNGAAVGL